MYAYAATHLSSSQKVRRASPARAQQAPAVLRLGLVRGTLCIYNTFRHVGHVEDAILATAEACQHDWYLDACSHAQLWIDALSNAPSAQIICFGLGFGRISRFGDGVRQPRACTLSSFAVLSEARAKSRGPPILRESCSACKAAAALARRQFNAVAFQRFLCSVGHYFMDMGFNKSVGDILRLLLAQLATARRTISSYL